MQSPAFMGFAHGLLRKQKSKVIDLAFKAGDGNRKPPLFIKVGKKMEDFNTSSSQSYRYSTTQIAYYTHIKISIHILKNTEKALSAD